MGTNAKNKDSFLKQGLRMPVLFAGAAALVICLVLVFVSTNFLINRGGDNDPSGVAGRRAPQGNVETLPGPDESRAEELHGVAVKSPTQSVAEELHGVVEVLAADEEWQAIGPGSVLEAGTRLRTGALSSATLAFYDGSRVVVGPQSELTLDQIQAGRRNVERIVVMTQFSGESQHDVAHSTHTGSRYEVHTAAATGAAKGTKFTVTINASQGAMFQVNEGQVAVTGSETTVLVESGQTTVVNLEEPPAEPAFFFTGQGAVTLTGSTWVVAGQVLTTHTGTVIVGDPQVGDEVFFQGRLQADDTRLVDLIVLLKRSAANRFSLTGIVEDIADGFWTVNGQLIAVTDVTLVDTGIVEDDLVEVEGLIMDDGTLQAETIRRLEKAPGLPFDFTGVVQTMGPEAWVISDITVAITGTTVISGSFESNDMVRVTGWILESGVWLAERIQSVPDETREFEFTGAIESMAPWIVAGVSFETRDWTVIEAGLVISDQVRVKGQVMSDGTWVASEISRLEDLTQVRIVLVGVVTGMDPWVVSGVTLTVDGDTLISRKVVLGMLVRVEIQVLDDGTWKVIRIDPLGKFELPGSCQEVTAVVQSVSGNKVQLEGWPALTLGEDVQVAGELKPNSVVLVQICYDEEGNPQIVYIYIILEPEVVEPPDGGGLPGENVEICHKPNSKNPHTIVVSQSALPGHLGHGDSLGPCP
ncbi:MAG: hypothetical protein EHM70_13445 [Chloroflexota bacterium]|nr:MAG: hypothetical protein EHM70_13445 [Chloroflexota bacterium]